jgi:hypothetical protein
MDHFFIKDMSRFCEILRKEAVFSLSDNISEKTNIDEFITLRQCEEIVNRKCKTHDESGVKILNEDIYANMLYEIAEQIYQSALSKLAASDIIECAWDDNSQKMIFWTYKDNNLHNINYTPLQ